MSVFDSNALKGNGANEKAPASRAQQDAGTSSRRASGVAPQRARIRMSRWLFYALLTAIAIAAVACSVLAFRQNPHPDLFRTMGFWDVTDMDWWRYPLERNAFKRNVIRGDLEAVCALPGTRKVWAVGNRGLIVHSDDGGVSWVQQHPAASAPETRGVALSLVSAAHAQASAAGGGESPRQQTPAQSIRQQSIPATNLAPEKQRSEVAPPSGPSLKKSKEPSPTRTPTEPQKTDKGPTQSTAKPQPLPPPDPETANLRAVFFASADAGWAAGVDGTILATHNGGVTWRPQTTGTRVNLFGVQFLDNGRDGWAVGAGGTILATRDAGATWQKQASGTQALLFDVQFLADGRRGWAVGENGTILATRDAGATWQLQPSGTKALLQSVQVLADGRRGWAVGLGGTVLMTRDAGATWEPQRSGAARVSLQSVHFLPDGQQGSAVGDVGTVITTRDAGATWEPQPSGTRASLHSVRFLPDGQGWAVGREGTILATRDGGITWYSQTSGARVLLRSLQVLDDGRGWAVGSEGTILATRDGGTSWQPQASGTQALLQSVQFLSDGRQGWAVGGGGAILATHDGGTTWRPQTSGTQAALGSVQFLPDGQQGWAVGQSGTILATRDAGATWQRQMRGFTQALLTGVQFLTDGRQGWIVGDSSSIFATRDGGATWRAQLSGANPLTLFTAVQFLSDGRRGWIVGSRGTILTTQDAGTTWQAQASGASTWFQGVQFLDSRRGWAVGSSGSILTTGDGGTTWQPQTSRTQVPLLGVQLLPDGRRGWVIGSWGTILATRDGGSTWKETAQYRRYFAPWYFAAMLLLSAIAAGLFLFADISVREEAHDVVPGAATTLRSDEPVADKAQDRLGYRPAVEALAAFIRNKDTEPRVTLAVTGEWGSGKSSIMRMLQTELRRAGFRTAWFNAWHQQQEGRPLAALFNTIRQQAVPSVLRNPIAALRVRSRLIWGRGAFYKIVAITVPALVLLALGDLLASGHNDAASRVGLWVRHHLLQMHRTVVTGESLAKLDPFLAAMTQAKTSAGTEKKSMATPVSIDREPDAKKAVLSGIGADHCDDLKLKEKLARAGPTRPDVFCYMKDALMWDPTGDRSHCGEQPGASGQSPCVFARREDLIATVSRGTYGAVGKLWPSEVQAIGSAAETLPPPTLFPGLEYFLLPLIALLGLFVTKGVSVYGLQLVRPLQNLFSARLDRGGDRKEPTGTIERFRAEFALLADALDGRLVVFIDDLDRCAADTVNGMMELTNYLVDVGRCFVVIGADMDRVMACIKPPAHAESDSSYANEYLRKLVHIELPVPEHSNSLHRLFDAAPGALRPHAGQGIAKGLQPGLRRWGVRLSTLVLVAIALWLVFLLGEMLHQSRIGMPREIRPVDTATSARQGDVGAVRPTGGLTSSFDELQPTEVGIFNPTRGPELPWLALGALALGVAGALGWRLLRRHREQIIVALGGVIRSEDSARFVEGLGVWRNMVSLYDPTPRGIKRFYNRARLFGAHEHEDVADLQRAGQSVERIDDAHIVAMAAIHHADPKLLEVLIAEVRQIEEHGGDPATEILERFSGQQGEAPSPSGGADDDAGNPSVPSDASSRRRAKLVDCLREHCARFGSLPSSQMLERFYERVKRIHVR